MTKDGLATLLFTLAGATQALAQDTRTERILEGFKPDVTLLKPITGDAIARTFSGRTVMGIYKNSIHEDQRFTETMTEEGRVAYKEGSFTSTGDWYAKGNFMCFKYDEQTYTENCFREYRYGDCIINFPDTIRVNLAGKPHLSELRRWGSVQRFTTPDFEWPDVPTSEVEPFACEVLAS